MPMRNQASSPAVCDGSDKRYREGSFVGDETRPTRSPSELAGMNRLKAHRYDRDPGKGEDHAQESVGRG